MFRDLGNIPLIQLMCCLWKSAGSNDLIASIQLNMQCNSGTNKASRNLEFICNGHCTVCDKNPMYCKYFQFLIRLVSVLGSESTLFLLICIIRNVVEWKLSLKRVQVQQDSSLHCKLYKVLSSNEPFWWE